MSFFFRKSIRAVSFVALALAACSLIVFASHFLATRKFDDCAYVNATVAQFEYGDYMPPNQFKWIRFAYSAVVQSLQTRENITIGASTYLQYEHDNDIAFFSEQYAPVGRRIEIEYNPLDPSGQRANCVHFLETLAMLALIIAASIALLTVITCCARELRGTKEKAPNIAIY